MRDLITFATTSTTNAERVKWYLKHQLDVICTPFFRTTEHLKSILSACDTVVSGSAALRMVLPSNACNWHSSDLDIYVPLHNHTQLYNLLRKHDYIIVRNGRPYVENYSPSTIYTVTTFTNGKKKIDVIVSRSASALSPIFHFHSTAVMNFFSADSLFCTYPSLTLRHRSMINTASLRQRTFSPSSMQALLKYKLRGFRIISCEETNHPQFACRTKIRSLNDRGWLSLDFETVPRRGTAPIATFFRLGIVDAVWTLGGQVCGSTSLCVQPIVHIIEDCSYVTH
ncbi:hypothetical protein M404DRAFT_168767 [Pisolithus tinctorius Marx 270]|uniref:Uncharacterized protein n=1 Tax=Pisolithus tinctorius Marx 270 TaxID=870435 RepID=A0A0C3MZG5_PISTI|nr:hypothetical protein M404DRAFT_168767 [Pisolithus tinctorius Marx 270]